MSESLAELQPWLATPHTYARYMSDGKWLPYAHVVESARQVRSMLAKGGARIILNWPPRHGKSEFFSYWLPAWTIDMKPWTRVILGAYEATMAEHWGRKVRDHLHGHAESSTMVRQDIFAARKWQTPESGGMVTAGVQGGFTGRGADLLILDDPHKNYRDAHSPAKRRGVIDWFNSTFYTRAEPNANIIVIMTRWHEDDLCGYLIREHADDWQVFRSPAIAEVPDSNRGIGDALCPERFTVEQLDRIRRAVGPYLWSAMYQQRPSPAEGAIFERDWFKYHGVDDHPTPTRFDALIQSWDLAFKKTDTSSYVVGQVLGRVDNDYYLLDQERARATFPETIRMIGELSERWPEAEPIYVEDKANGPAVIDTLNSKVQSLQAVTPQGDKVACARAVTPIFEQGNFYVPDPEDAPWVYQYIDEMMAFPNGKNDDQVDSTTQGLIQLRRDDPLDFDGLSLNLAGLTKMSHFRN